MKAITLGGATARGRVALIDDDDYELVAPYSWYAMEYKRPGKTARGPYAATMAAEHGRRRVILMHALITGYTRTDHINHDGLDNRRANLRPATAAENKHNARPCQGSSSRHKGVSWISSRSKWQAGIKVNDRQRNLGLFANEDDAALAYNAAALEAWGEYAYLNQVGTQDK